MDSNSFLNHISPEALEEMYRQYKQDAESVDAHWRRFFEGFEFARTDFSIPFHQVSLAADEFKVIELINEFRSRGHLFTLTNPVRSRRKYMPTLDIENFGFNQKDLDREFEAGNEIGLGRTKLRNIIDFLKQTYCQSLGIEYMYIRRPEITSWLRQHMENTRNQPDFSIAEKRHYLQKLTEAVLFEKFIHTRFPGQKRFSLEGTESLIPGLEALIESGSRLGASEFVIGMSHRGRLNVLSNIMHKPIDNIFTEFAGKQYGDLELLGDVKYHLGFTSDYINANEQKVRVTLCPNPSHLEAVDPVVEGIARAKIDRHYNGDASKVIPILIHGDAAIAGQGIVYEIVQMSELEAYHTGGTIHVVINNQIGFTTNYLDARSSIYCTDVAKIVQSPIFHVNGDDVESVVYTFRLAAEYREKFKKDVFIDILSYRKYGHNEGDEPRFTQPLLYKIIEKHPNPREIYLNKLISEGFITDMDAKTMDNEFNAQLEEGALIAAKTTHAQISSFMEEEWTHIRKANENELFLESNTAISESILLQIGNRINTVPDGLPVFRKLARILEDRKLMLLPENKIDWAMAELLAYGTLVNEGFAVRFSGQDVERGTFSHRHAVVTIEDSEKDYCPLQHIDEKQAPFQIYNSLLSEYGVLGFEYGYSLASPDALVIWEAQFGDFNNGAQIIIDQFITAAEEKWAVFNNLVMFLPHGYEGQGAEHSSARMERFLAMAASENIQIADVTTPANLFHLLRRQLKRPFRKPLILFTPKSLLRHPECRSSLSELSNGSFHEVLDDPIADPEKVTRLVFCTGKVFYDLVQERIDKGIDDTAIVRIEQLYPFPEKQIKTILQRYAFASNYLWVQEEPGNMGAWTFIARNFKEIPLRVVCRPDSGSPATGSHELHKLRQRKIIEKAFNECSCENRNAECRMTCSPQEYQYIYPAGFNNPLNTPEA